MFALIHVLLLIGGMLLVYREAADPFRRRFASGVGSLPQKPRPAVVRPVVATGVSLVVAFVVLVVNMSCILGCAESPMQRVIDGLSLLPMLALAYYVIRSASAVYWHARRVLHRGNWTR